MSVYHHSDSLDISPRDNLMDVSRYLYHRHKVSKDQLLALLDILSTVAR
jgi:hypothetical protein